MLSALAEILPEPQSDNFQSFKRDFIRKFEQGLVPIMVALDPEIGVGYGGMEDTADKDDFIATLSARRNARNIDDEFGHLYKVMFNPADPS